MREGLAQPAAPGAFKDSSAATARAGVAAVLVTLPEVRVLLQQAEKSGALCSS